MAISRWHFEATVVCLVTVDVCETVLLVTNLENVISAALIEQTTTRNNAPILGVGQINGC